MPRLQNQMCGGSALMVSFWTILRMGFGPLEGRKGFNLIDKLLYLQLWPKTHLTYLLPVTPVTHHPPHTRVGPVSEPITSYGCDRMSTRSGLIAGWNGFPR